MCWFDRTISCFSPHFTLDKRDDSDAGRQQSVPEPREESCKTITIQHNLDACVWINITLYTASLSNVESWNWNFFHVLLCAFSTFTIYVDETSIQGSTLKLLNVIFRCLFNFSSKCLENVLLLFTSCSKSCRENSNPEPKPQLPAWGMYFTRRAIHHHVWSSNLEISASLMKADENFLCHCSSIYSKTFSEKLGPSVISCNSLLCGLL